MMVLVRDIVKRGIRHRHNAYNQICIRPVRLFMLASRIPIELPVACLAAAFALIASNLAIAGEISGLPSHLPPTVRADYLYFLGNDFAASGTSDDYRTEQMMVAGRFRESWLAVLDHSILTRDDLDMGNRARIDTMTLSLGYEFLRTDSEAQQASLAAGMALRGIGNYAGERIQNGFHRLVASDTDVIPYTDTRETDPAAWFVAEYYKRLSAASGSEFLRSWDTGLWARTGAFGSAGGYLDAVAGLYAMASRPALDLWLGIRRDWRSGYDQDFVLQDTAAEENKYAVSFGVRFGALVIETVQRMDSAASYGQLSFVSSPETRRRTHSSAVRFDGQLSLQMPQVTFQAAARWHRRLLTPLQSTWGEAAFVEIRGGQPQLGRNPTLFVDTTQVSLGNEWFRAVSDELLWLRFYTNVGGGWRREQLLGRAVRSGQKSEAVDRAVLTAEGGIEIDAAALSKQLGFRLRLGVTGWLPLSDAVVNIGNTVEVIQRADASIVAGWVLSWH